MGLKYLIFFIVLLMKKISSIPSGNFAYCNCKVDKLSNKVKVTLFLGKFLYKTDIFWQYHGTKETLAFYILIKL